MGAVFCMGPCETGYESVDRYNWHSAGTLGWPFPVLKYKCILQIKYTEATSQTALGK